LLRLQENWTTAFTVMAVLGALGFAVISGSAFGTYMAEQRGAEKWQAAQLAGPDQTPRDKDTKAAMDGPGGPLGREPALRIPDSEVCGAPLA
jgi:hypothetical protein